MASRAATAAVRRSASALATSSSRLQQAYVEALKVIGAHGARTTTAVERLQQKANELRSAGSADDAAVKKSRELERISSDLQFRVESHRVDNLVKHRHGEAKEHRRMAPVDMSDWVHRTMALKHYKQVRMHKILQKAEQHHLFDDLFPKPLDGSLDVEVHAAVPVGEALELVENAAQVPPAQTVSAPAVHVQPYHADVRKYTVLLVDCDMPHDEEGMYKDHILWLNSDVALSATQASRPLPLATAISVSPSAAVDTAHFGKLVLPYVPPHPTRGTKDHRIALLVCEQTADMPALTEDLPRDTPVHRLLRDNKLKPRGLTFWRAAWDESVSHIYRDILKVVEPRFVRPSKIGLKGVDDLKVNKYGVF
ncbi:39S ribosomal protein L38, mitochondrial [Sorochytrium milnesiophthora]